MLKKRLTLRDIAKKANVSLTSASMYLNGKARANHISEKTCARIEEVIRRENYQPNVNARAMAMKRTNLVGCVMRDSLEALSGRTFLPESTKCSRRKIFIFF